MEKRIGSVLILMTSKSKASLVNSIISNHSSIIIGRQGLPVREGDSAIISLVLEGSTDQIGSLTGQLGRISGIQVKSSVLKIMESDEKN
jgi:putative iron-only hydrogenase system regulator